MIKRLLLGVVALLVLLVAVLAVNTWRQGSRQIEMPPVALIAVDAKAASESLAAAILARTVSSQTDAALDADQFEGLLITEGVLPGLKPSAEIIGLAEKGFLSVALSVGATPGHSSMPPPPSTSAVAMMSGALKRLDDQQLPASITGVAQQMFDTIAPEMSGFGRVALSNLWLFGPIVQRQLEAGASTNAMLHTTTALTIVSAGNKENVLPGRAAAAVNFRLLPGDSLASVQQHVKQSIANEGFQLQVLLGAAEPSKVAPTDSASYKRIERTVRELLPGTIVSPGRVIGGTDSQHFGNVSDHIYKFLPVRAKPADLPRFHGNIERITMANLAELIRFYHRLLSQGAAGA